MKKPILGAVALASLLAVPAASLAAATAPAPRFGTNLIVPNKSLGGITLNAPAAAAKRVLTSSCNSGGCSYTTSSGATLNVMFFRKTEKSKLLVGTISVSVPTGASDPFASLKSAQGIGIGSSYAAVEKAYPHALKVGRGALQIKGKGELETSFDCENGKVIGIGMESIRVG